MHIFRLEITLGNDAMQTPQDVADALQQLCFGPLSRGSDSAIIRDRNGNDVGRYYLEPVRVWKQTYPPEED